MTAFWFIFEKLRYMVYAFLIALTATIGAGIAADDIDPNTVQAWLQYRTFQVMKFLPVSNVLHKEAIIQWEQTAQEKLRGAPEPVPRNSLSALRSRQELDLLRAEKARQQEEMDRLMRQR